MIRSLLSALAIALGPASSAAAHERSLSAEQAPLEWIAYAERVQQQVTSWLMSDEPPAVENRAYLDSLRPGPDQPPSPLTLRIWITGAGSIERIEFPPFADAAANDRLRSLLVGREIGTPPPADMLLPIRLAIEIEESAVQSETAAPTNLPPATP